MAERFARRIPSDAAFEDERQVSWELVGNAYLKLGNSEGALRALEQLPLGAFEAEFRYAFAKWAAEHSESDLGRQVLRETVAQIARLGEYLGPRALQELAGTTYSLLGQTESRRILDQIPELGQALKEHAAELLSKAGETFAKAKAVLGPKPTEPPDSAVDRLARYLRYRHNDLKIRWLVDQAAEDGLADPILEAMLQSETVQRLEAARQPSIHEPPLYLEWEEFGAFLFDRPIPLRKSDRDVLLGDYMRYGWPDHLRLVELATQLFLNFEPIGRRYSEEQINQGLWFLFAHPYQLFSDLGRDEVPTGQRRACVNAMLVPFREYYQHRLNDAQDFFFMWWDYARDLEIDTAHLCRQVLEQVIALPHKGCQLAALHGLSHLHRHAEAGALIARYLEAHRDELKSEEIVWIGRCRNGRAL